MRDIGDVRLALQGAFETSAAPSEPRITRTGRALLAASGILAIATVVTTWGWLHGARSVPTETKNAYIAATLGLERWDLTALTDRFAVSPDGTLLALVDRTRGGLVLRRTSDLEVTPVTGAPLEAFSPVFSPDGEWIAFSGTTRSDRRVVLLDRAGAERELPVPPGTWLGQTLSADGRWLALTRLEGANRTLWTVALETGALTQVTYRDDTFAPRWAPDGRRLVYSSFPMIDSSPRTTSVWSVLPDGQGMVEPVAVQWDAYPSGFSADGRVLYYYAYPSDQAQSDILSVPLDRADPKPTVLLATPASEAWPTPAPDGRFLAYETNASGADETRVAPLADLAASVQVSTRGGTPVRFSPDGAKLYFTDGDAIASVDIGPRGPVLASRRSLFSAPSDRHGPVSVTSDGNHAVAIRGGLIYSDIVVLRNALSRLEVP